MGQTQGLRSRGNSEILTATVWAVATRRPTLLLITVVYTLLDSELLCSPCPQERATTDNGSLSSDPRSGGLQRTGGPKLWLLGGLQESEDAGNAGDREGQKGAKSPSLVGGGGSNLSTGDGQWSYQQHIQAVNYGSSQFLLCARRRQGQLSD